MTTVDQKWEWTELLSLGAQATDPLLFLEQGLPRLRELAGAGTVVVIQRSTEGPVIVAHDGLEVPTYDVATTSVDRSVTEAPSEWAAAGFDAVLTARLAGNQGSIVLGWQNGTAAANAADPVFAGALDLVVMTIAKLEAESSLADLIQRVNSAQQLASMGDYDWHIATDTNQWSDQLYRIYGFEPGAFNASYERFLSLLHPEDRDQIQAVHQAAYGTGEPYQMTERIIRPDGEIRYLASNGEVIRDETGTPIRMRGTCIDITERVLAEQEHQLISARFQGLVESSPEAILVVEGGSNIVQANPRAVELLGADPTLHSLGEILVDRDAVGRNVPAIGLDGRDLVLDVNRAELGDAHEDNVSAIFLVDAVPRLEREAMAQRLGESRQRRRQALEINDNVVQGLAAASYALDQLDLEATERYLTRTLGAARSMMDDLIEPRGRNLVAGDLVRAHAATLSSHRTDVGDGVELAVVEEADGRERPVWRVLLVDDAEDIRTLLRLKLHGRDGFNVVGEAVDGMDAVEQARALQPNLVLLDMAMPRMDGLQALPLIREAVPGVRVIVLSGFNQSTLEEEALAAGADRYVVKGGSMRDLVEVIVTVLEVA